MEKYYKKWLKLIIVLSVLLLCHSLFAQKYFDSASVYSDSIRLTILNPSASRISTLCDLRNRGVITIERLLVIGVYHDKERTNYSEASEYKKKHGINWLKFHKLSGTLNESIIFQENSYTKDFENIFYKSDGVMLFGGSDIPPSVYGHSTNLLTSIATPFRHYLELSLAFHLLGGSQNDDYQPLLNENPEFPVIGFCLGAQTMNVAAGGTMIQDIWSEVYGADAVEKVLHLDETIWHKNPYVKLYPEKKLVYYHLHKICLFKKGKFITEFGFNEEDTPLVLSGHHQMVDTLGKDFKIIASSMDGRVPEAIEHLKYSNVLGVQFHPEYSMLWDPEQTFQFTPSDTVKKSLFSVLEKNPPSVEFHKKLWSWFVGKLVEYHELRESGL